MSNLLILSFTSEFQKYIFKRRPALSFFAKFVYRANTISFPLSIIPTLSHILSAISRMCVVINIVVPRWRISSNKSFIVFALLGSSPPVGSSRNGVPLDHRINAAPMAIFFFIPSEYPSINLSADCESSNNSINFSTLSLFWTPRTSAINLRNSLPVNFA